MKPTCHLRDPGGNALRRVQSQIELPAFTLVELLVVIAIIGLLCALLLPSLSKAKSKATSVIDIANLKQQTLTLQMYATDSDGRLPWPNWFAGDGPSQRGWLYTLDTTATGSDRFKLQSGQFFPLLKEPKLFVCPWDHPDNALYQMRDQKISSYVMNGAVIGYDTVEKLPRRLEEMGGDSIAFWETDEREPFYFNDGSSSPDEGVSRRHIDGAINATFGGAASFVKFGTWYRLVAETNKNALWCYPGSTNGRGP